MDIIDSLLQGILQGATEFLPVSSSGHLSIYQHLTGQSSEMGLMFSVFLHFGTLIAVFIAFRQTIGRMIAGFFRMARKLFTGKFRFRELDPYERMAVLLILGLVPMLFAYFLRDFYESFSTDGSLLVEGICFLATAVLLYCSTRFSKPVKPVSKMSPADALIVGCVQAVAPLPGLSRSGSTISAGLLCGLERQLAVEFSFILGVPAVLAANLLELKDAVEMQAPFDAVPLLVGIVTAAVVGFLAIKLVQWLIRSDHFRIFAWYTLAVGLLCVGISVYELASGVPVRF